MTQYDKYDKIVIQMKEDMFFWRPFSHNRCDNNMAGFLQEAEAADFSEHLILSLDFCWGPCC